MITACDHSKRAQRCIPRCNEPLQVSGDALDHKQQGQKQGKSEAELIPFRYQDDELPDHQRQCAANDNGYERQQCGNQEWEPVI